MKKLYTAVATSAGGREGHVRSADGIVDLDLRVPQEMGGPGGAATNPEQLFAAGYSACFESALRASVRTQRLTARVLGVIAHVGFNLTEDRQAFLNVDLIGRFAGATREEATALMEAAHAICPYSKATRGNIEVHLSTEIESAGA